MQLELSVPEMKELIKEISNPESFMENLLKAGKEIVLQQ